MNRREFLAGGAALAVSAQTAPTGAPARFQIGCMTMPYRPFPLQRALEGIAKAGCRYVGWGGGHAEEGGQSKPMLPIDASPAEAGQLAKRCRDMGLEPVMMFGGMSVDSPDSIKGHTQRIKQAAAAGMPFVVTYGNTKRGNYEAWIRNLKELGPVARGEGVRLALKPHGGNTSTGQDCSKIIADTGDEAVKICYDSGNVLDYVDVDPIPDIQACWRDVACFAIKDHRNTPGDQDCGPGFGEIDHYKLLMPLLKTGLTIPLICENIFPPLVPRPKSAEDVDKLVERAREFLEVVVGGLQSAKV